MEAVGSKAQVVTMLWQACRGNHTASWLPCSLYNYLALCLWTCGLMFDSWPNLVTQNIWSWYYKLTIGDQGPPSKSLFPASGWSPPYPSLPKRWYLTMPNNVVVMLTMLLSYRAFVDDCGETMLWQCCWWWRWKDRHMTRVALAKTSPISKWLHVSLWVVFKVKGRVKVHR